MVTQELTPGKACQKGERAGYIELSKCIISENRVPRPGRFPLTSPIHIFIPEIPSFFFPQALKSLPESELWLLFIFYF